MVALKEDVRYLKKEVKHLRKDVDGLKKNFYKIETPIETKKGYSVGTKNESEAYRIKRVVSELKTQFPDTEFDKSLLKVVGIMSEYRRTREEDMNLKSSNMRIVISPRLHRFI